jgi:hypothetical protein
LPDPITHLALGYIVSDLRGYEKAVFLMGSLLPDVKILSRLVAPFLADNTSAALFYAFDAPITFIPLALMASAFFRSRRQVFTYVSYAILLHLGLDFLQYQFGGGILPLFPAVAQRFSAGLFWPDDYYVTALALGGLCALLIYRRVRPGFPSR